MRTSSGLTRRKALTFLGIAAASGSSAGRSALAAPIIQAEKFRTPRSSDRDVLATAIQEWIRNGTGTLSLERGRTYSLGLIFEGPDLFEISGIRNAVLEGNGAVLQAQSKRGNAWNLLSFSNVENLEIRNLRASDSAYSGGAWGMKMIVLQPGESGTRFVHLENIQADGALAMFWAQGPVEHRVSGVSFGPGCRATNCYYAICCENQGDRTWGAIATVDCRRAYLAYGIAKHDLTLDIRHNGLLSAPGSQSAVLVKSYGRSTSDIVLTLNFSGSLPYYSQVGEDRLSGYCAKIEHQNQDDGHSVIEGIDLTFNIANEIDDPFDSYLAALTSVGKDGTLERKTRNVWSNITIRGYPDRARGIDIPSSPETPFTLEILGDADRIIVHAPNGNVRIDKRLTT